MLDLTVANVFAFIFRYLLPISFFNNYSSVPTDRYTPLDIKGFQRFHGEPNPALSTAEPGDEGDQEPNQAVDPYEKVLYLGLIQAFVDIKALTHLFHRLSAVRSTTWSPYPVRISGAS
jgi:hypothetical protein